MAHLAGAGTFAALDLGTTNCRLLVARPAAGDGFRVVDSFSRVVRLGEGLETEASLRPAAIERTLRALEVCAGKLAQWRAACIRAVATEACRRADNCDAFVERVRAETGIDLEIISSAEEARLVLNGCAPLLNGRQRHAIVFDIGGGSTEVQLVALAARPGARPRLDRVGMISLPHGVVSLTERFAGEPTDQARFAAIVRLMRGPLAAFDAEHAIAARIQGGGVQMLGSSGTVTTLAAIELGLARYDRARIDGVALEANAIRRIASLLTEAGPAGRAAHPCIGPGRADLMIAGCAILTAICETWPVERVRVADRGVREGILLDLIAGAAEAEPVPALVSQAG